ncbi:MAG: DUF3800 domain-containing protein [Bacteroidota bacterium]
MHFFYIDEAGSNGHDLGEGEQPIFISGGIILKGEGWDKTHGSYQALINNYFDGNTPENFVLHVEDLFSPNGRGDFLNHTAERRQELINDLVNLVSIRRHNFYYFAIDKKKLDNYDTSKIQGHLHFDLKTAYLIAYNHLITAYEKYTTAKLGKTARAMLIIEEKQSLQQQVAAVTNYRRFVAPVSKRVKSIAEFSYPVNAEKNTMIQLSDLLLYITRQYLEIDNGYSNDYTAEKKNMFHALYKRVHDRLIFKTTPTETGRNAEEYNNFITAISCKPGVLWKEKIY